MTGVRIVGGKLTVNSKPTTKADGRLPEYRYPAEQYQALLKIAKAAGIETGDKKARQTQAINPVTAAVLGDFVTTQHAQQQKPKSQQYCCGEGYKYEQINHSTRSCIYSPVFLPHYFQGIAQLVNMSSDSHQLLSQPGSWWLHGWCSK